MHMYFLREYESTNGPLTFCERCISGKIWFLNDHPKPFKPIRMPQKRVEV